MQLRMRFPVRPQGIFGEAEYEFSALFLRGGRNRIVERHSETPIFLWSYRGGDLRQYERHFVPLGYLLGRLPFPTLRLDA
jgi:hypothetical protein